MTRANWTSATAWPDRPPPFHPWKLFFKAYPTKSLSLPLYPTIFSLYPSGLSHSLSAGRLERNLAALPQVFDEPMRREVWMSVQPEAENRVEVRALLDLIEHAFDDRRDWFGR